MEGNFTKSYLELCDYNYVLISGAGTSTNGGYPLCGDLSQFECMYFII